MQTNFPIVETETLKRCAGCEEPKPLSAFGRNAANDNAGAKDGLNIRCRSCINKKIAEHRQSLREYKASRQKQGLPAPPKQIDMNFSPRRVAWMLRKLQPKDRVLEAIRGGAETQTEIARVTRLRKDEVGDAICAMLLYERTIRTEILEGDDRRYFVTDGAQVIARQRQPVRPGSHGVSTIYSEGDSAVWRIA